MFYTYGEEQQLEVVVHRTASTEAARAIVDEAAPIDSTSPADSPAGWSGGRSGGTDSAAGAVYAVSKDSTAVVVRSNQAESVKAQAVAEEVIRRQGL